MLMDLSDRSDGGIEGMISDAPKVSIVMPAYNMERYICAAIHSVQEQTYPNWELIVIDDSSQDSTCRIVERLANKDQRIRLIRNEKNIGVAQTRNRGFELASGEYLALLDSDDLWRREKLARQVSLAEDTGADVIYCSYAIIDEAGRRICDDFIVPQNTNFENCLSKIVISCSTALLSRNIYKQYRFNPNYYHEDLVFWLQLLHDKRKVAGAAEVLADYRVHDGTRASNKLRTAANRWKVYRSYFGLSVGKSAVAFIKYACLGVKKYWRK